MIGTTGYDHMEPMAATTWSQSGQEAPYCGIPSAITLDELLNKE